MCLHGYEYPTHPGFDHIRAMLFTWNTEKSGETILLLPLFVFVLKLYLHRWIRRIHATISFGVLQLADWVSQKQNNGLSRFLNTIYDVYNTRTSTTTSKTRKQNKINKIHVNTLIEVINFVSIFCCKGFVTVLPVSDTNCLSNLLFLFKIFFL